MNIQNLGKVELRALCKEYGIKNYGKMDNAGMRAAILANADKAFKGIEQEIQAEVSPLPLKANVTAKPVNKITVDHSRSNEIISKTLAAEVKTVNIKPAKAIIQNGIRKPLKAGLTKQAWEIYDTLASQKGIRNVLLKDALVATNEANLNPAMSRTQFYWWRTFNGISGKS